MATVPRALLMAPEWSSTAAVEAMRLWNELPEGLVGLFEVTLAAERALLDPAALQGVLDLLVKAGLLEAEPDGYTRRAR